MFSVKFLRHCEIPAFQTGSKGDDDPMYPPVVNDEKLRRHVADVGRRLLGPDKVKPGEKIMEGEYFAFYRQLVPGVLFGIASETRKLALCTPLTTLIFSLTRMSLLLGLLCILLPQNCISEASALNNAEGTCNHTYSLQLKVWVEMCSYA